MVDTWGKRFTVLFAGGGTGGHLMPGLTVAAELKRCFPESRQVFVGSTKAIERSMVERHGFEFHALPSAKRPSSPLGAPAWTARMVGGLLGARKLIHKIQPNVVVSLGCYAAFAPSLAARLAGVPLVIMEQNAYPGKTNRLLSWWADEVYAPWRGTEAYFAYPDRVQVTGNPVRGDLRRVHNRRLANEFGLSPRKKTLLVMGGSQGARFINQTMAKALDRLEREAVSWLQVLHSTGEADLEETRAAYERSGMQATVLPFIEDMSTAYAVASLAVCRAGGTTLAELTTQGVPAILIPLPIAANDHQRRNAARLAGLGAAVLVDQSDLTAARLADAVLNVLRNDRLISGMRNASIKIGCPEAARNVVSRLCGVLQNGSRQAEPLVAPFVEGG